MQASIICLRPVPVSLALLQIALQQGSMPFKFCNVPHHMRIVHGDLVHLHMSQTHMSAWADLAYAVFIRCTPIPMQNKQNAAYVGARHFETIARLVIERLTLICSSSMVSWRRARTLRADSLFAIRRLMRRLSASVKLAALGSPLYAIGLPTFFLAWS